MNLREFNQIINLENSLKIPNANSCTHTISMKIFPTINEWENIFLIRNKPIYHVHKYFARFYRNMIEWLLCIVHNWRLYVSNEKRRWKFSLKRASFCCLHIEWIARKPFNGKQKSTHNEAPKSSEKKPNKEFFYWRGWVNFSQLLWLRSSSLRECLTTRDARGK